MGEKDAIFWCDPKCLLATPERHMYSVKYIIENKYSGYFFKCVFVKLWCYFLKGRNFGGWNWPLCH